MSDFAMQMQAALSGSVEAEIEAGRKRLAAGLREGVDRAGAELQSKWRQDVSASRLSNNEKLARTVRLKSYPRVETLEPAAVVYSSAPKIQAAFERGEVIRPKKAKALIIPNPAVWGRRLTRPSGRFASHISSLQIAERAFGKLSYRPISGRKPLIGLLTAKAQTSRAGKVRRASEATLRRGKAADAVIFFVLTEARQPRLLRGDVIRARAERDAPETIARYAARALQADGATLALPGPATALGGDS